MMLKYSLTENLLTDRYDDYSAHPHAAETLNTEELIDRMLDKGTTLTRTDVLAVLNALEETVVDAIVRGRAVNLPLFNTSFSISGVFESPLDVFDANRHRLHINLTKGALLREAEKRVKLEKTNVPVPLPQIQEVKDVMSGTVNDLLTPRGVVELRGYNLKIEGGDSGLYLVNDNGDETHVDILVENKPSRIIAVMPDLPEGGYRIKLETQFSNGVRLLRTPKIYTYPKTLIVEN